MAEQVESVGRTELNRPAEKTVRAEVELTEVAEPVGQKLMKTVGRGGPVELVGVIEPVGFVRLARPAPLIHSAASAQSVELARYHHFHP